MSADHIVTTTDSPADQVPSPEIQQKAIEAINRHASELLGLCTDDVVLDPSSFREDFGVQVKGVLKAPVEDTTGIVHILPVRVLIAVPPVALNRATEGFRSIRFHPTSAGGAFAQWRHIDSPGSLPFYAESQDSTTRAHASRVGNGVALNALRDHN